MGIAALTAYIFTLSSVSADLGYCKFSDLIEREVNADNVAFLHVTAGAGELEITGQNRQNIKIVARLCSNNEEALRGMNVSDKTNNKTLRIQTQFPKDSFWGRDHKTSIDLALFVPQSLALKVKDSSGSTEIAKVASLDIVDSSGELNIEDIAGDVIVVDSSGALNIENINGNVTITDSSGDIEVRSVEHNLTIEVDSSGAIEADHIKGHVLVKVDSSGAIIVNNVNGDFTVTKDSSGGIKHNGVKGRVSLPK